MKAALNKIARHYTPNKRYLKPADIKWMINDWIKIYTHFLKGRMLTRLIYKLEKRLLRDEAQELSKQLKSSEDFIDEVQGEFYLMAEIEVINEKKQPTKRKKS